VVTPGGPGDQKAQAGAPGAQQRPGIAIALQHGHVADGELAADDVVDGRHHLAGQLTDALLVARRGVGETVGGPHAPVQAGLWPLGELEGDDAFGVDDGHAGEAGGVDGVGFRVLEEELAQRRGLLRRDAIDDVATASEEHGHGQPRRAGGLDHHLEDRALRSAGERSGFDRLEALPCRPTPAPAQHGRGLVDHHHGVLARDAQVDADDAACLHLFLLRVRGR
jgi:hypothetical protein